MEKICLIQAGRFLIGIDAALIRSTRSIDSYAADEDTPLLHLESFFGQQPLAAQVGIVLELDNESKLPALLIDRVIGEIDATVRFEPLPLLYPQLAAACCPRIFVDEQQVYLLLELEKIEPVHEQLQTDYGFVFLSELSACADDMVEAEYAEPFVEEKVAPVVAVDELVEQPEEQEEENELQDSEPDNRLAAIADDKVEAECAEPLVKERAEPVIPVEEAVEQPKEQDEGVTLSEADDKDEEQDESTAIVEDLPSEEESLSPDNRDTNSAEQENPQPLTGISDEILQKIVSWTIGKYIGRDQNEKAVINATDLPLPFVQPQGLSIANVQVRRDIMQNIINKTVWRCEQLNEASLLQLQKKYGKN